MTFYIPHFWVGYIVGFLTIPVYALIITIIKNELKKHK